MANSGRTVPSGRSIQDAVQRKPKSCRDWPPTPSNHPDEVHLRVETQCLASANGEFARKTPASAPPRFLQRHGVHLRVQSQPPGHEHPRVDCNAFRILLPTDRQTVESTGWRSSERVLFLNGSFAIVQVHAGHQAAATSQSPPWHNHVLACHPRPFGPFGADAVHRPQSLPNGAQVHRHEDEN